MVATIRDAPSAAIPLEQLMFEYSPRYAEMPPALRQRYAAQWREQKQRFAERVARGECHEGDIIHFGGVDNGGERVIRTGNLHYSDREAMRAIYPGTNDAELFRAFEALSTVIITELREGDQSFLVFGHRAGKYLHGRYWPPSGFINHVGTLDAKVVRAHAAEELREELGLPLTKSLRYHGIAADDTDSCISILVLSTAADATRADAHDSWRAATGKREHNHLIAIPNTADAIDQFLSWEYSGVLNPQNGLAVENGRYTNIPEEALGTAPHPQLGEPYQLIEIGVGAFALYAQHAFSLSAGDMGTLLQKWQRCWNTVQRNRPA